MNEFFRRLSARTAEWFGSPWAFLLALLLIAAWVGAGFRVGFGDTFYQLVINTGTTIVTFLAVFLIQNTQNRDARARHLKLDELLRAKGGARNTMIDLDRLSDGQIKELEEGYKRICDQGDHAGRRNTHPLDRVLAAEADETDKPAA